MNEVQSEQTSEAGTQNSRPEEVKVEENVSRTSESPDKSQSNDREPSPAPKASSPVIISFTSSKNTNGNNGEHNTTSATTGSPFVAI
jgi:hypothetical protein